MTARFPEDKQTTGIRRYNGEKGPSKKGLKSQVGNQICPLPSRSSSSTSHIGREVGPQIGDEKKVWSKKRRKYDPPRPSIHRGPPGTKFCYLLLPPSLCQHKKGGAPPVAAHTWALRHSNWSLHHGFFLIFLLAYLLAARIFGNTRKVVPGMESGERLSAQTAGEATKDEVMRKI